MAERKSLFKSFWTDGMGSVLPAFAASAVVVIAVGGASVDYMRASLVDARIQSAIDASVLAGVSVSLLVPMQIAAAERHFKQTRPTMDPPVEAKFVHENGALTGRSSLKLTTSFLKLVSVNELDVEIAGSATASPFLEPACVMAMHPHRKHTLELHDAVSVIAPKCHFYGNSDHLNDVVDPHTSATFLTGKSVAAVGGGHHFLENVTPPVEFGYGEIADPMAATAFPAAGPCTENNFEVDGGVAALTPGVYCGGLTIKGGADVTFQSGTYHISGGLFEVNSATARGTDVTVFLDDTAARLKWTDAAVKLEAPATGAWAGFAVVGIREEAQHLFENSTIDIHGVLYMPKGDFVWKNTGTPVIGAKWSAFIADGFSWMGDGVIDIPFDLAASAIPYPSALRVIPRPGSVRLVR